MQVGAAEAYEWSVLFQQVRHPRVSPLRAEKSDICGKNSTWPEQVLE